MQAPDVDMNWQAVPRAFVMPRVPRPRRMPPMKCDGTRQSAVGVLQRFPNVKFALPINPPRQESFASRLVSGRAHTALIPGTGRVETYDPGGTFPGPVNHVSIAPVHLPHCPGPRSSGSLRRRSFPSDQRL